MVIMDIINGDNIQRVLRQYLINGALAFGTAVLSICGLVIVIFREYPAFYKVTFTGLLLVSLLFLGAEIFHTLSLRHDLIILSNYDNLLDVSFQPGKYGVFIDGEMLFSFKHLYRCTYDGAYLDPINNSILIPYTEEDEDYDTDE